MRPLDPVQPDLTRPALIIPILNEIEVLPTLLDQIPERWRHQLIIIDNDSTDGTWEWLQESPVMTFQEPHRGYGAACYAGMMTARTLGFGTIIFMDGDGSSPVDSLDTIEGKLHKDPHRFVFTTRSPHAGPWHAKVGTQILLLIVLLFWGRKYQDMGPMRGASMDLLHRLKMTDRAFAWTLEMQIRVLQSCDPFCEIPVKDLPRLAGRSKISGSLAGTARATAHLFGCIFRLRILQTLGSQRVPKKSLMGR